MGYICSKPPADVSCKTDRLGYDFCVLPRLLLSAGPLVVGLTLSAIAVGAAFSAGALAFTTFILPMVVLMGVGGLASFGLFAGLGAVFVLPQLLFSALSLVSECRCGGRGVSLVSG